MSSDVPATTLRLTAEDHAVLAALKAATGLTSTTAVVRLAIREARDARAQARAVREADRRADEALQRRQRGRR